MNVIKRRWPDLLIGLLVLLLLAGFVALLLGKGGQGTGTPAIVQTPTTQSSDPQTPAAQSPDTQTPDTQTPATQAPDTQSTTAQPQANSSATPTEPAGAIPTIPSTPGGTVEAPADSAGSPTDGTTTPTETTETPSPTVQTPSTTGPSPRAGGAVATSESRTPTRNDYRISLGSFDNQAAAQAATAGVSGLGYTVYPIAVASGVVAQVGPFASREVATQALADIQRALPGALLYAPRNPPPSDTASTTSTQAATPATANPSTGTPAAEPPAASTPASNSPVYLQVGAYNTTAAAQTAVDRVRGLGLEPSVNAPSGKLVTVVVGPFQGRALADAEAKLQAGGIDSFRVR